MTEPQVIVTGTIPPERLDWALRYILQVLQRHPEWLPAEETEEESA